MEAAKPLEILFADADLAQARPLRVELRRRGASVRVATSGTEAAGLAKAHAPDLVVMDEGLTRGGEADLVEVFRSILPDTKVILLHPSGAGRRVAGPGIFFVADKPASKFMLLQVIASAFPGRLGSAPADPPAPRRVLCVDDDAAYLHSLGRFLRRRGYEVFEHESAWRALEALPGIRPELAVVDLLMPGMDGLELTRKIRDDYRGQVPVVVLTGVSSQETYHRAKESGASYCLFKPCRPEDFLNVVDFIAGDLDEEERRILRGCNLSPAPS